MNQLADFSWIGVIGGVILYCFVAMYLKCLDGLWRELDAES
jgi:hypothetical protein